MGFTEILNLFRLKVDDQRLIKGYDVDLMKRLHTCRNTHESDNLP